MSSPKLDSTTLKAQVGLLEHNHRELNRSLEAQHSKVTSIEAQLAEARKEVEQYLGALSYSRHIQEQTLKVLEQTIAAELAAAQAAKAATPDSASPA